MEKLGKEQSTKKILFVAALHAELKVLREVFTPQPEHVQADFFVSGVWCLETSMRLTQKLSESPYDFIINIWICGYRETRQDIIQIARSVYLSTDRELLIPQFIKLAPRVSIACSEVPVYESAILWEENYVDMESYALEKLAEYFRVPRLILKVPYDKIWQETYDFNPSEAQAYLKNILTSLDIYPSLVKYFSNLTEKKDISSYLDYYPFTVSEKIIFEKYFYSYITLASESFEVFFNTHKGLEKKAFLKELSNACEELKKL
jgi:nucleoside phosphorylase